MYYLPEVLLMRQGDKLIVQGYNANESWWYLGLKHEIQTVVPDFLKNLKSVVFEDENGIANSGIHFNESKYKND